MTERKPANPLIRQAVDLRAQLRDQQAASQARKELREQVAPLAGNLRRQIDNLISASFKDVAPVMVGGLAALRSKSVSGEVEFQGEQVRIAIIKGEEMSDTAYHVRVGSLPESLVIESPGIGDDFYIQTRERDTSKPVLVGGVVPFLRRDVTVGDIKNYKGVVDALADSKVVKDAHYLKPSRF